MKFGLSTLGVLLPLVALAAIWGQASSIPWSAQNLRTAPENCNITDCFAPYCRCSTVNIPKGYEPDEIPQFVLISFDDAVTTTNFPIYEEFSAFNNPNGCPIKLTFFVSHESTDYTLVHELHRLGHEIASHSISMTPDIQNYWNVLTEEQWIEEIVGMKEMLNMYGLIPEEEITGFRAPFLQVGGNTMYRALQNSGFQYDSSWPTLLYTTWYQDFGAPPRGVLWPYTLDYLSVQEQTVGTKPTDSFPGFWVNPMTDLRDNTGEACSMVDQCDGLANELDTSGQAVFDLLKDNFHLSYLGSKAPFGVYTRESWFEIDNILNSTAHRDGFRMFLNYLSNFPDVWVVSVKDVFDWVKNPILIENLEDDFENVKCPIGYPPSECRNQVNCHYTEGLPFELEEAYMKICGSVCPEVYPWVGNIEGQAQK